MNNILLICKKELKSYFASPIAYLLMAFFGADLRLRLLHRDARHGPLQLPGADDGPAAADERQRADHPAAAGLRQRRSRCS